MMQIIFEATVLLSSMLIFFQSSFAYLNISLSFLWALVKILRRHTNSFTYSWFGPYMYNLQSFILFSLPNLSTLTCDTVLWSFILPFALYNLSNICHKSFWFIDNKVSFAYTKVHIHKASSQHIYNIIIHFPINTLNKQWGSCILALLSIQSKLPPFSSILLIQNIA